MSQQQPNLVHTQDSKEARTRADLKLWFLLLLIICCAALGSLAFSLGGS